MKKNRKINIAFAGTPEIAFDIFEELSKKDFQINFILTQTDKKAGRGAQLKSSKFLEKKDIYNVLQPENLNDGDFKNGIHVGEDLYENDGFIVHYFSKEKVNSLLDGFNNITLEEFEEGTFPRKLFFVINEKKI